MDSTLTNALNMPKVIPGNLICNHTRVKFTVMARNCTNVCTGTSGSTSHLVYIATSWCTEMLWDAIKCTQLKKAFTRSQFWMHTFWLIVMTSPWNAVSATRLLKVQQICIIHHELVHRDDKSVKCPHIVIQAIETLKVTKKDKTVQNLTSVII